MLVPDINLLIPAVACCLAVVSRRYYRQKQILKTLNKDLDNALRCLSNPQKFPDEHAFHADLEQAQMENRLHQNENFHNLEGKINGDAPDKYRHVVTLANHGLTSDAIGDILNLSPIETEQLLQLFKCAQN